jgi:muramoyltetrapeptide carboxypeptidase
MSQRKKIPLRIRVIAPAAAVDRGAIELAAELLIQAGHTVTYGRHLFARYRYFAGHLEERLADLVDAARDETVDVIWFARGGMGGAQLLAHIDGLKIDKPVIGHSDNFSLLHWISLRGGFAVHGPVFEELSVGHGERDDAERADTHEPHLRPEVIESLALLSGTKRSEQERSFELRARGNGVTRGIRGVTLGGNLTSIVSLVGTPWQASFGGALLFLEDVGEAYYRLERMLFQLLHGDALSSVRAICLGDFDSCPRRNVPHSIEQIFAEYLDPLDIPLFNGLPFGHGATNRPWRVGGLAEIKETRVIWEE